MNERIRDLALTAIVENITSDRWVFNDAELEKFAQLIVRECISKVEDTFQGIPDNTTPMWQIGFQFGVAAASENIKQHFGVEE
jgi:hypothetical protein